MSEVCDRSSGCKRMGNFKVSLVGPDLRPLGGVVANKLIAASSVQVLLSNDKQVMLIFKVQYEFKFLGIDSLSCLKD
jgi:hypothetical protein